MSNYTSTSDLVTMSAGAFRKVIDQEIRGGLPANVSAMLRKQPALDRFYMTLLAVQKITETTLAKRSAEMRALRAECLLQGKDGRERYLKAEAKAEQQRASTLGFKTGLDELVLQIRWLREATAAS